MTNEEDVVETEEQPLMTREQILGTVSALKTKTVAIKSWDNRTVRLRELTGAERDSIESALLRGRKSESYTGVRARAAALSLVDARGARMFTDKNDEKFLSELSGSALDELFVHISELSGMSKQAEDDLGKNS